MWLTPQVLLPRLLRQALALLLVQLLQRLRPLQAQQMLPRWAPAQPVRLGRLPAAFRWSTSRLLVLAQPLAARRLAVQVVPHSLVVRQALLAQLRLAARHRDSRATEAPARS